MGVIGDIAGIFASTQEKRAASEAVAIINQARQQGMARSAEYETEFTPFISMSKDALTQAGGYESMLRDIISQVQGLDVEPGLSGADRIAYEDAARLLNEQMVSTGNLRSGAAAFGQAQLLRRVVADASQRSFDRKVAKLNLLFGGQGALQSQALSRAQTSGQIGLYGKQLSSQILQAAMGLAPAQATAEQAKGSALGQSVMFGGSAVEGAAQAAMAAYGNFGQTTTTNIPVGEGTASPAGH